MKHLLLSLTNFFSERKRFFAGVVGLLFISALSLIPLGAHAEGFDLGALVGGVAIGTVTTPIAFIMWIIFKITSLMLGLAGVIFNWAVLIVVFDFAKYFGNSEGMTLAWGILRDFANIGLLFGFVFMGIATILDLHKYPWTHALPKLVIYAVLLNFSLFATEAIIDATNVVSATLYQQTYGEAQQCTDANWLGCVINTGLAAVILDRVEITTVYSPDQLTNTFNGVVAQFTQPIENILKYVLMALFTTVAAVVLFGAAAMLISRGITLAFLMVTSPIGFAGLAIPFLEGIAQRWWKKLIDQALFAPVFILLLLASLKMTDGLDQLVRVPGGLGAALALGDVGSTTGTLIFFALTMGFMVASLAIAQQFGIYGSDAVMKNAQAVIGRVGGVPLGVMGWMGRRTLGSASLAAASGIRNSRVGKIPILGSTLAGIADRGARASYDIRGKSSGLGQASAAAQGGRIGEIKDAKEREVEYNKSLAEADKDKYAKAKYEKEILGEQLAKGLASGAKLGGTFKQYKNANTQMGQTTESVRVEEEKKKHAFDEGIKNWNDAGTRAKEAMKKVEDAAAGFEKAERALQVELGKPQAQQNQVLIQKLNDDMTKFADKKLDSQREEATAMNEQHDLENSISSLGNDIVTLRKTINKQETTYRRNVERMREPNVAGFSVVDRDALRDAAMSMRKSAETAFKPKNLNEALSKALKANLNARGLNIPNP